MAEAFERHIDKDAVEKATRELLIALGDNPEREGLVETPKRVAKFFDEVMQGMLYTNHEIAQLYNKTFVSSSDGLVVEKDIPIFSWCEHHIALMYDMNVSIAYLPHGRVIGLSKMARVAEMCGHRLQLQERLTQDIYDVMSEILGNQDVAVFVTGKHSCMTARGIKKPNAFTTTNVLGGAFKTNPTLRAEVIAALK